MHNRSRDNDELNISIGYHRSLKKSSRLRCANGLFRGLRDPKFQSGFISSFRASRRLFVPLYAALLDRSCRISYSIPNLRSSVTCAKKEKERANPRDRTTREKKQASRRRGPITSRLINERCRDRFTFTKTRSTNAIARATRGWECKGTGVTSLAEAVRRSLYTQSRIPYFMYVCT